MEKPLEKIVEKLTKKDAPYIIIIVSLLGACILSFKIGSSISEFFGAIFGILVIVLVLFFFFMRAPKDYDYFDIVPPELSKLEALGKSLGPIFPWDVIITYYEQARFKAIKTKNKELAKELENKIKELKELESKRSEMRNRTFEMEEK